jgi:hypothetical protein
VVDVVRCPRRGDTEIPLGSPFQDELDPDRERRDEMATMTYTWHNFPN